MKDSGAFHSTSWGSEESEVMNLRNGWPRQRHWFTTADDEAQSWYSWVTIWVGDERRERPSEESKAGIQTWGSWQTTIWLLIFDQWPRQRGQGSEYPEWPCNGKTSNVNGTNHRIEWHIRCTFTQSMFIDQEEYTGRRLTEWIRLGHVGCYQVWRLLW